MTLLGNIASRRKSRLVFRLARQQLDSRLRAKFFAEHQFDEQLLNDMREEGYIKDLDTNPEEFLDEPFQIKRQLNKYKNKTRFSNGDFPVFYSSLDPETAESEAENWLRKFSANSRIPRTAHYQLFHCKFEGTEKDLRAKVKVWPDLMNDSDYTFCNRIGSEAVDLKLDCIVTFSVRRKDGVNVPIFTRSSISDPGMEAKLEMTYDPNSGNTTVKHATGGSR